MEAGKLYKKSKFQLMLTAAAIIALINILVAYGAWAFNIQLPPALGILISVVSVAGVFIWMGKAESEMIEQYKPGAGYGYGSALGTAVLTSLIAGLIVGLAIWLLYNVIDPNYIKVMAEYTLQQVPEAQQTDELSDAITIMLSASTGFIMSIITGVIGYGFWGLLVALFTSIAVKKAPTTIDYL